MALLVRIKRTLSMFIPRIVKALDKVAAEYPVNITDEGMIKVEKNLALMTMQADTSNHLGVRLSSLLKVNTSMADADVSMRRTHERNPTNTVEDREIFLSSAILQRAGNMVGKKIVKVTGYVYRDSKLFANKTRSLSDVPSSVTNHDTLYLDSGVISANIVNLTLVNLTDPVRISLQRLSQFHSSLSTCVFWNFERNSEYFKVRFIMFCAIMSEL